jgi:hypothetical protein
MRKGISKKHSGLIQFPKELFLRVPSCPLWLEKSSRALP